MPELPKNQSPKQSYAEDHTEQIEATSGEDHCRRTDRLKSRKEYHRADLYCPKSQPKTFRSKAFSVSNTTRLKPIQHAVARHLLFLTFKPPLKSFLFEKVFFSIWCLCRSVSAAVVYLVGSFYFSSVYSVTCFCMWMNVVVVFNGHFRWYCL